VMVFHGVNLPLLLKLLNYRRNVSLEDLARKLQASIGNSIGLVTPLMAGMDEAPHEPVQDETPLHSRPAGEAEYDTRLTSELQERSGKGEGVP